MNTMVENIINNNKDFFLDSFLLRDLNQIDYSILGRGCHSTVFLLRINDKKLVLKLFNESSKNKVFTSAIHNKILKNHSTINIPKDYFVDLEYGAICSEFSNGIKLSKLDNPDEKIANQVVDNLISYHSILFSNNIDYSSKIWIDIFQKKIFSTMYLIEKIAQTSYIDDSVIKIYRKSIPKIDKIIGKIDKLSLIHGDYTPWNILVDSDENCVNSIIDPDFSFLGDSQYDLFALNKGNGKSINLFTKYLDKSNLKYTYELERKLIFYDCWNELTTYCYSPIRQMMKIEENAYNLKQII